MKKTVLTIGLLSLIGCSIIQQKSAFQSGWTEDTNEDAYNQCGLYHLKKDMPIQHNLDLLVSSGRLTPDQAQQASRGIVNPGDPECLAYAVYGLSRKEISVTKNLQKQTIEKSASYSCRESNVVCPGIKVRFADGKVIDVTTLVK